MSEASDELTTDVALCFSGGGYRAAAYHLGTLAMLHELGMQDRIKYFSTASGGTIVAMKYILARCEKQWEDSGDDFDIFATEFKKFLLDQNIVKDAFEAITEQRFEGQKNDISLIRAAAGIYDKYLTGGVRVKDLKEAAINTNKYTDLIFNVTEFRTGGGFRFRIVRNSRLAFGSGNFDIKNDLQGDISLADIAAASSCYPGAFEPIRFPEDFDLPNRERYKFPFGEDAKGVQSLPMMDGGIFDNQGVAGLMTSYEEKAPFDFVLISDTTQKAETILDYQIPGKGRLFDVITTFYALFIVLFIVFVISVVSIGLSLCYLTSLSFIQIAMIEITAIFSAMVSGALLIALSYIRFRLESLDVMGAKFPIWNYISALKLSDIYSLLSTRVASAKALLFSVFMKRVRDLNNKTVLAATSEETRRNLLFGKNVFSHIYDLEEHRELEHPLANDKDIKATPRMVRLSIAAGKVPTALWIEPAQIEILVECGRITACLALLRLSWSKWQKLNADAEDEAAKKRTNAVRLPPPNDPNSVLYAEYSRIKKKWKDLVKVEEPDAPET